MPPVKEAPKPTTLPPPTGLPAAFPPTKAMSAVNLPPPKPAKAVTEEVQQDLPVEYKRPIIYPTVQVELCTGTNAFQVGHAKQAMGWETEREYQAKMMAKNPGTEAKTFLYGDVYMGEDVDGNKVRCNNNLDNRPFDEGWSNGLAQTILNRSWSGAITIDGVVEGIYGSQCEPVDVEGIHYEPGDPIIVPAGTINGSTICISQTGRVESGQHSMWALVRAHRLWEKDRLLPDDQRKYKAWDDNVDADGKQTGPVLETILVTGVSEDPRVLMTVDNCKQRSEMDVLYTSELFRIDPKTKGPMATGKRKELSRMMAACLDFFWKRTKVQGYKTHAETMALLERHPKLLKALEHIFVENADVKRNAQEKLVGGRMLSNLKLSPGQCVALCYIMGCSASDGDEYRNCKPAPQEKGVLDWSRWDQAKQFWALLGGSPGFKPVRDALLALVETDPDDPDKPGLGGRLVERLAILAKAWDTWLVDQRDFTALDLEPGGCLHLQYSPPGEVKVPLGDGFVTKYAPAQLEDDEPDFGGIDVPEQKAKTADPPMTKEEQEARAEQVRKDKAKELADRQLELVRQMRANQATAPVVPKPVSGPSTAALPKPGSLPPIGKPVKPTSLPPAKPPLKGGVG